MDDVSVSLIYMLKVDFHLKEFSDIFYITEGLLSLPVRDRRWARGILNFRRGVFLDTTRG